MRSAHLKPASGRVVVALLGLVFLKAMGDLWGGPAPVDGREAEAYFEGQDPVVVEVESARQLPLSSAPTATLGAFEGLAPVP